MLRTRSRKERERARVPEVRLQHGGKGREVVGVAVEEVQALPRKRQELGRKELVRIQGKRLQLLGMSFVSFQGKGLRLLGMLLVRIQNPKGCNNWVYCWLESRAQEAPITGYVAGQNPGKEASTAR